MEKKVEEKKKVLKISSTGRVVKPSRKLLTSSDDESKRPKKKCKSNQSMKRMKQEIDRLRLIAQKLENTKDDKIYVNASDNNDPEVIMCEETKETLSVTDELSSGLNCPVFKRSMIIPLNSPKETNLTHPTSSKVNSATPITGTIDSRISNEILERNRSMENKVEENMKVSKTSSTDRQSVKLMKQELNRLQNKLNNSEVITYKNSHFSSQMAVDTKTKDEELLELSSDTEFASDTNEFLHKNTDENSPSILDSRPYLRKRSRLAFYPVKNNANATEILSQMAVDTKTKDEELLELSSDTEFASDTNEFLHKNTDENNSPSILDSRPYLRKRSRLAFYPVKNNANATENSATTLVNNTSEIFDEDEVIEASPMQRSRASKVIQCLKLKKKIPVKRIDFGLCSSPKHTSMIKNENENENVSTLKDKVNTSYLSPIKVRNKTDIEDNTFYLPTEQTGNRNKLNNFNLDDTENKPPEKKKLLNKFNV